MNGRTSAGFALQDIDIDNGSGLSRTTHISALQMADVLRAAYHSRYAPEFLASLPLAGIDGTLQIANEEYVRRLGALEDRPSRQRQLRRGLRHHADRQDVRPRVLRQPCARRATVRASRYMRRS